MPETFESVWAALTDDPAEAANMRLRSALMIALRSHIEARGATQVEAARRLGITQPRLNDLLRGPDPTFVSPGAKLWRRRDARAGLTPQTAHYSVIGAGRSW